MEKPNLKKIELIAGDSLEFKEQLIAIIKEELPIEINLYKNHLVDNEYLKCAEDVHKLKHKISILNLDAGYELAISYENELRAGAPKSAVLFDETLNAMINFVEKL